MSTSSSNTASAATDVTDFFQDLDGGVFERMLSQALSRTPAAVVDHDAVGEVNLKLVFRRIPGTHQVHCKHVLKFQHPTALGKASEEATGTTPLHVGKFGRLTLAPESQMSFIDRAGNPQTTQPGA